MHEPKRFMEKQLSVVHSLITLQMKQNMYWQYVQLVCDSRCPWGVNTEVAVASDITLRILLKF